MSRSVPSRSDDRKPGMSELRPLDICPYCGNPRDPTEEEPEHVLPKALGGNLPSYNPLTLPVGVHSRCNETLGDHVDSPFLRQPLIAMARSHATHNLTHIGRRPELSDDDLDCDLWFGPHGERIFHFHEPYPSEAVEGSMIKPKWSYKSEVDSGFAILRSDGAEIPEVRDTIGLFSDSFGDTPLYGIESRLVDENVADPVPDDLVDRGRAVGRDGQEIDTEIAMGLAPGDRFLAKMALGVGTLVLRPSFPPSQDADLLRQILWERDHDKREDVPVGRAPFFHGSQWNEMWRGYTVDDCHLILLYPATTGIHLAVVLYGRYAGIIRLTDDSHATSFVGNGGIGWLISHPHQRFVEIDSMRTYIGWVEDRIQVSKYDEFMAAVSDQG